MFHPNKNWSTIGIADWDPIKAWEMSLKKGTYLQQPY